MENNLNSDTLSGDAQLTSSNGGESVNSPALTLADLNATLGKDFKDSATALKALKDTQSYVGKRREDIATEMLKASPNASESLASDVQSLKKDLFFSQNPQYKSYESLINKIGSNPADVVNSPEFSGIFEKVKVADEVVNNKSIVNSNSRLAENTSTRENAIGIANARGSTEDVSLVFARAINDANQS
jgi:hypothetical protein